MNRVLDRLRRRAPQRPVTQETTAVPAGAEPQDPEAAGAGSFRDRARLRRRLRYLRRVRELGFRDVGGLVFDLHRFGRSNDELVSAKLAALDAVDRELRALETTLDDRHETTELHEPGIGACPRCGALHASEARFCSGCGLELRGPRVVGDLGPAAPATTVVPEPAVTPPPSS
jgi:hypothetical protein